MSSRSVEWVDMSAAVVQLRQIPESIVALSGFDSTDYFDVFRVETEGTTRAPEQWARALLEDAAGIGGQFVFRGVLGLRLTGRRSPNHVGGWKIADRGDRWIRLEAVSWLLEAHIVVQVDEASVSVGTFLANARPIAKLIWTPMSTVHRQAMPFLLRKAARSQARP